MYYLFFCKLFFLRNSNIDHSRIVRIYMTLCLHHHQTSALARPINNFKRVFFFNNTTMWETLVKERKKHKIYRTLNFDMTEDIIYFQNHPMIVLNRIVVVCVEIGRVKRDGVLIFVFFLQSVLSVLSTTQTVAAGQRGL